MRRKTVLYVAPLCPAGHLPHKGGDQPAAWLSPIAGGEPALTLPISPLVGEMSALRQKLRRTEGGVKEYGPIHNGDAL
jgi:hypothetical protein